MGIFDPITRFTITDLINMWKCINGKIPTLKFEDYFRYSLNESGRLKANKTIYLIKKLTKTQNQLSWMGRICHIWNETPLELRILEKMEIFKKRLKELALSGNLPVYQNLK